MLIQKVSSRSWTLHGNMTPGLSRSFPRLCVICIGEADVDAENFDTKISGAQQPQKKLTPDAF